MHTLPEISEADARGEISDLYETIRAETGSTLVNYIWRHLATIDGAAQWAWDFARLNDDPELAYEIGQSADIVALQSAQLASPAVPIALDSDTQAIIKVYNTNNVANLARVMLLKHGLCAPEAPVTEASSTIPAKPKGERLPALPRHSDISADQREFIERLATAGPAADTMIIPSLWRHLTIQPGLLSQLTGPLETTLLSEGFRHSCKDVSETAMAVTTNQNIRLPRPINFNRKATLDSLERFSNRLVELAIAGRIIVLWSKE
jgi:hypothetical protein